MLTEKKDDQSLGKVFEHWLAKRIGRFFVANCRFRAMTRINDSVGRECQKLGLDDVEQRLNAAHVKISSADRAGEQGVAHNCMSPPSRSGPVKGDVAGGMTVRQPDFESDLSDRQGLSGD